MGGHIELAPEEPVRSGSAQARKLLSSSCSALGRSLPENSPWFLNRFPKKQPSVIGKLDSSSLEIGIGEPSASRPSTEIGTWAPYRLAWTPRQAETSCCSLSGID